MVVPVLLVLFIVLLMDVMVAHKLWVKIFSWIIL